MTTFTNECALTVAKLSSAEKTWIKRLQKVLSECPERLELMTSGDACVTVIDAGGAKRSDLSDGAADRDGVVLAIISGGPIVHGVSA